MLRLLPKTLVPLALLYALSAHACNPKTQAAILCGSAFDYGSSPGKQGYGKELCARAMNDCLKLRGESCLDIDKPQFKPCKDCPLWSVRQAIHSVTDTGLYAPLEFQGNLERFYQWRKGKKKK